MLISFVFHPKHRSKSSAVRVVLVWLPVLERVCISLVSLFRRRALSCQVRLKLSGQIGCQGDGPSRQPILGVHMLSMTHREAAIFDDACTVPTPCLLLPAIDEDTCTF